MSVVGMSVLVALRDPHAPVLSTTPHATLTHPHVVGQNPRSDPHVYPHAPSRTPHAPYPHVLPPPFNRGGTGVWSGLTQDPDPQTDPKREDGPGVTMANNATSGENRMGRHHEDEPERRRDGGLRWKGDTSDQIPVVPAWETHEGITEHSVAAFVQSLRSTNPPGMEKPPEHARYAWLIERCSDRLISGEPVRRNAWVRIASGYTDVDYPTDRAAAIDMMRTWFLWNGIVQPEVRRLHTIWTRHATEASWSERLDGR